MNIALNEDIKAASNPATTNPFKPEGRRFVTSQGYALSPLTVPSEILYAIIPGSMSIKTGSILRKPAKMVPRCALVKFFALNTLCTMY